MRVFDVVDGVSLANGRLFAVINPGLPDGFRFEPQRLPLHQLGRQHPGVYAGGRPPRQDTGARANRQLLLFGGPQRDQLYITATSSLYVIRLNTRGIQHA